MKKMKYCKKLLLVGMIIIFLASPLYAIITFERWYGGVDFDRGLSVVQTANGEYFITGVTRSFGQGNSDVYLIKTDSLGDTLWTKTYGGVDYDMGSSGVQTSDGGYIITGGTGGIPFTDTKDIYIIKIDSLGDSLWTRTYGTAGYDAGSSIIQTLDGNFVLTGVTISNGIILDK